MFGRRRRLLTPHLPLVHRRGVHARTDGGPAHRQSEAISIAEALTLAVATIVIAWAGYSAAQWSTDSRLDLARASTLRLESNSAIAQAEETRNFDASTFNAWFIAYSLDRKDAMVVAERRFRPAFRTPFDAWLATDPEHNPAAPPGPTFMPQYQLPDQAQADQLVRQADAAAADGDHAAGVADNYLRITLVLSSALFLVGVGTTFWLTKLRWGLVATGGMLLGIAIVVIALQPHPV
jgi:hypothetical protein